MAQKEEPTSFACKNQECRLAGLVYFRSAPQEDIIVLARQAGFIKILVLEFVSFSAGVVCGSFSLVEFSHVIH